jgi:rhamnulokinase
VKATTNFVAIDLGASSGRLVVGCWDGRQFALQELHRFPNGHVNVDGHLKWSVSRLWSEIGCGLLQYASRHHASPAGISVDAWGVDFALLGGNDELLGDPFHYRDPRTEGVPQRVFSRLPERELFQHTGIQTMQINTLFQLFSMVESGDTALGAAQSLLMIPDLFHFLLSGEKSVEYTEASTTQMLLCREQTWANDLLRKVGIPERILGPITYPGTILGGARARLLGDWGLKGRVPVIAAGSHDTASAVAAIPDMDEHSVFLCSGTWSLMGVECKEPVTSDEALALHFTNEGGVDGDILLLRNIPGLWLLQECVRQWRSQGRPHTWDELMQLAKAATPFRSLVDTEAREFLAPDDMPSAIRAHCRRSGQPEPQDDGAIARCCLDSLALRYRTVLEALETLTGRDLKTIRVVGGGSQNRLLSQLTADVCQRVVIAGPVEASCLGNVMVQAIATGSLGGIAEGRSSIAQSVDLATYEPRPLVGLESAYHRFCSLVEVAIDDSRLEKGPATGTASSLV